MDTMTVRLLFNLSFIVILVGVPFIVLICPQFPGGHFTFRRRMLISMLVGWVMIIVQQYFSQRYEAMQPWDGELRTDLADGLIFYIGWFPMILGAVPSLVICAIDDYRRKHGLSGLIRPFKERLAEQVCASDGDNAPNQVQASSAPPDGL